LQALHFLAVVSSNPALQAAHFSPLVVQAVPLAGVPLGHVQEAAGGGGGDEVPGSVQAFARPSQLHAALVSLFLYCG